MASRRSNIRPKVVTFASRFTRKQPKPLYSPKPPNEISLYTFWCQSKKTKKSFSQHRKPQFTHKEYAEIMTWKSNLLRNKIQMCMENSIRGILAEKLTDTEMKIFLLFNDQHFSYTDIALYLDLQSWAEARAIVNKVYDTIRSICSAHPFKASDFISLSDDEYTEDDLD